MLKTTVTKNVSNNYLKGFKIVEQEEDYITCAKMEKGLIKIVTGRVDEFENLSHNSDTGCLTLNIAELENIIVKLKLQKHLKHLFK